MEAGVHAGTFTHDSSGAFQMLSSAAATGDPSLGADTQAPKRSISKPAAQPQSDAERLATEAVRAQKVKEKNKRAQQRFRERQKAKSTETQSEVSRLKLQVGTLQAQLAEAEHSRRLLDQGAGPSMGLSAFSAGIKPEGLPYGGDAASAEALQAVHSQASAQDLEPRNGWVTLRPDNTLLMALGKQGPTRLTAEDLRLRSLEQHDQFWKDYVEQLAMSLVEIQSTQEPNGAAQMRCTELVNELTCYTCMMVLVNPRVMLSYLSSDQEDGQQGSLQWRAMLKSLGLTEEQKRDLMISRTFVLTSLASLLEERGQLAHTLQEGSGPASSMRSVCQQQCTSAEVAMRLQANIQATNTTFQNFLHIVHKRVLAPMQVATIIVQSYPRAQDMLAFVNFLAGDLDEPSQTDLLSARPQQPALQAQPQAGPQQQHQQQPHGEQQEEVAAAASPPQDPSGQQQQFLADPRPSSEFWATMKRTM